MNKKLQQAAHDYYTTGESQLTDAEFDSLAPTDKPVGVKASGNFAKVKHAKSMLSLKNAFTAEEVIAHLKGIDSLVSEFKFDGLSLSLIYEKGKLIMAKTRGDGEFGDDVTENAKQIASIPQVITHKEPIEIRGEVLMLKTDFQAVNAKLLLEGEIPYSNPRNLAAGTMKSKDATVVAERKLTFYAYSTIGANLKANTQFQISSSLAHLGFLASDQMFQVANETPFEYVKKAIYHISKTRDSLKFEIDGIVFKADSLAVQAELGDANKYPNWAVAYKFPPTQVKTVVKKIFVQVGRMGTLTPVAEVEPVNLGGAIVKRATLCNIEEIERLGINVGSEVLIARAAEVIPKIYSCTTPGIPWKMPSACPSCGNQVSRQIGDAHTYCTNSKCPDQVFERLNHAFSKGALDVDGCGPAMVEQLIKANFVTKLSQALSLQCILTSSKAGGGLSIDTGSQAKKTLAGFKAALKQPFWRKLYALGIELIGQSKSKDIAFKYGNDINKLINATLPELTELLGPVAAQNLETYLTSNSEEIFELGQLGYWYNEPAKDVKTSAATGKLFVITGTLSSGSREAAQALIEEHGGVCKGGVNKKTDYLVVGFSPGAGKTSAAEKHGVKTITEDEMYALLGMETPVAKTFGENDL